MPDALVPISRTWGCLGRARVASLAHMAEDPVLSGGYATGELRPFKLSLLRGRDA